MDKESLRRVEKLIKNGLPEKEAKVYVAALELGRGTVTQIARRSGVSRTNTYNVLDSLSDKRLVRVSGKEPKEEYVAEPPAKMLEYFGRLREAATNNYAEAERLLPELAAIHKADDRPQIKFYEGLEGMKQVYEDTLTSTEPIHAYANYDDMHRTMGDYFPSYYQRRAKKGIVAIGIVPDSPLARERADKNAAEARQLVVVPKEMFDISPDIEIYDNKVTIVSWREKLGIIIESAEIADAMKKIFELSWLGAKTLTK